MPYSDPIRQRQAKAESARRRRAARKAERLGRPVETDVALVDRPWPEDPAGALAEWSRTRLKVPPGHARAGEPMELPAFAVDWLREALADGVRKAGLFVGRKNAKSAVVAVLLLGHLADDGPLRRAGWRVGVASVSREKSGELWTQAEAIALASSIDGIRFRKSPRSMSSRWGSCDCRSADRTAGHSSGYDIAVADELGLYPVKGRALVAGLLSSVSAKDGRLLAISVLEPNSARP